VIIKNQSPKGGTELQLEFLTKYVDKSLLDQAQICTSIPGKLPIDPNKVNILWQKNSYDQPGLRIKLIITYMIGTFLIHIGIMKNLE